MQYKIKQHHVSRDLIKITNKKRKGRKENASSRILPAQLIIRAFDKLQFVQWNLDGFQHRLKGGQANITIDKKNNDTWGRERISIETMEINPKDTKRR